MGDAAQQFGGISLGGRGGASQGNLKITENGVLWKKAGGGKTVEIPARDVIGLVWTKLHKGCLLGVKRRDGPTVQFIGFQNKDMEALQELSSSALDTGFATEELSTSGRAWGRAELDGPNLVYKVADKTAFRVPLPDVTQVQHGKDEVILEFPIDDAAMGDREDSLVEMAFHVPRACEDYPATEDAAPSKAFYDALMQHADVDQATGDAIATFESVSVDMPRGRFDVEMFLSFVKLVGQAQDYRIQYDSIVRIFVLPKTNTPQTLVVVSLDPPIRKGQTHYAHLMALFPNDEEMTVDMEISDDALEAKNAKCGGKLQRSMSGPAYEVFAKVLRGLSGAKLTKPGAFRAADGESYALRASYKAAAGDLYPLERAFFFSAKPPVLLVHDEMESVEFQRQGGGMLGASAKTFDLMVRMSTGTEYVFHSIQKSEWQNLFNWITAKKLPLENVAEAEQGPHGGVSAGPRIDLGEDIDAGLAGMGAKGELDTDEEDEDFEAGEEDEDDDRSEPSDSGSDADAGDGNTAAPKKRPAAPAKPAAAAKKAKKDTAGSPDGAAAAAAGGPKQRKPRKKKDKDAPKKNLSGFMFFSNAERDRVKRDNPDIKFTEIGKVLGEEWKTMGPEAKAKYEEMAARDKERYAKDMVAYNAAKAAAATADGGED